MNEERANLGCVSLRIQQRVFPGRPVVAAIERLAFAPATAPDDLPLRPSACARLAVGFLGDRLRHDVRAIGNQLAVHAKNGLQRALNLCRSVILGLQSARGSLD